jgi:cell division protein FtsB
MKLGKYLFIPWITLAMYTVLSVYSGPLGLVRYRALLAEQDLILENLEKLQFENARLEGTMHALRSDPETIRIRARELGYGAPGERFVRIVGLPGSRAAPLRPGIIRTAIRLSAVPSKVHRIITICTGLLLLGLFLAGDFCLGRETPRRQSGAQGASGAPPGSPYRY